MSMASNGGWAPLSSWYGSGMNVPGPYFRISFFGPLPPRSPHGF